MWCHDQKFYNISKVHLSISVEVIEIDLDFKQKKEIVLSMIA